MTNSRTIRDPAFRIVGDEQGTHAWYRPVKATKRGGMDGRESERLL